jgi:nitroimidazol reductase NimA-like FMN-containing flavoprotein (pyridoxamine 5'-phosphate oxidase superfamily)
MEQSYIDLGPSVAMSKGEIDRFLQQKLVARLTSIHPDGYPHTTPLWYVWDGEALWFLLGAGTYPRQHIRNLRVLPVCRGPARHLVGEDSQADKAIETAPQRPTPR